MQDEATHTLGTVSIGCASMLIVLYMMNTCLGAVPLLGLLSLFGYPLLALLAVTGVVTGVMGYRHAARRDSEVGKVPSILGAVICGLWLVFQVVAFGMATLLVVVIVAAELIKIA